jgi:hypothetical protein
MMKTLTESLKLIQEHIDLQMYGHAWDECQQVIEAVDAQIDQSAYIKRLEWALAHLKPATRNIDQQAWDTIVEALASKESE